MVSSVLAFFGGVLAVSSVREGFRIGFESSMVNLTSASSNMLSSFGHPFVIDSYLQTEVSFGKVVYPF